MYYDFDAVIKRQGTGSLKYDAASLFGMPKNILPLWVADMDFETAPEITEALKSRTAHGIYGYSIPDVGYHDAVISWMKKEHSWEIKKDWIVRTPGVVFAIAAAVRAFTKPGDPVLIQPPVYYPFADMIRSSRRKVIGNPLVQDQNGRYGMDFEDFEYKIKKNKIRLFILCSPHNPVGRVWTESELKKVGEICLKNHVTVVSDEIHFDFVYTGHQHTVFVKTDKALEQCTVICTAPSKTFNLAGLQVSNIIIPDPGLRKKFSEAIHETGYDETNTLGLVACEAAYRYGRSWYRELMKYLEGNLEFLQNTLEKDFPEIGFTKPEGTYLCWLDFRRLGYSEKELEERMVNKAGLWLDRGSLFGREGKGFERVNIACPQSTLKKALEKMKKGLR